MPKAGKINLFNIFSIETSKKMNFKVKLLPGHHQDAEYSPNRIYIYIYETVQLEPPPTISVFSKINEICLKIQYTYIYIYRNVYTYKKHIYIYICLEAQVAKSLEKSIFNTFLIEF